MKTALFILPAVCAAGGLTVFAAVRRTQSARKKSGVILTLAVLVLSMACACSAPAQPDAAVPDTDAQAQPVTSAQPERIPLTQAQLSQAAEAFSWKESLWDDGNDDGDDSDDSERLQNVGFVNMTYADVRQLDLTTLLKYLSVPEDIYITGDVTYQEYDALEATGTVLKTWHYAGRPRFIYRHTAQEVNDVLARLAGVRVDELDAFSAPPQSLSEWVYLEEFDAFYTICRAENPDSFVPTEGEICGDTAVLRGVTSSGKVMQMTLGRDGEDWHIRSFQPDPDAPQWPMLVADSALADEVLTYRFIADRCSGAPRTVYDVQQTADARYRVLEFPYQSAQCGGWVTPEGKLDTLDAFYLANCNWNVCGVSYGDSYLAAAACFPQDGERMETDQRNPSITRRVFYGQTDGDQPCCYIEYLADEPQKLIARNGWTLTFQIQGAMVTTVAYQSENAPMPLPLTEFSQRTRPGSLWSDDDLTQLLSSVEMAFPALYFADASELDSQTLYMLFQLLSSTDVREACFRDEDGQYHYTEAVICKTLDRWLKGYCLDLSQCEQYDAAENAIVTPISGGFGGGFSFKLLHKRVEDNICTILGARTGGDGNETERKVYTLEFYDGGVYLAAARTATDEENRLPSEALNGSALGVMVGPEVTLGREGFCFSDPDELTSEALYKMFLVWSRNEERLACENEEDGLLHFSESFIRSVLDRYLKHYRLDLSKAPPYDIVTYDPETNEIVTPDIQGGGGFDADLLSTTVDGNIVTYVVGYTSGGSMEHRDAEPVCCQRKEYRMEFDGEHKYLLSVRLLPAEPEDIVQALRNLTGDDSNDLTRQFWLYSRQNPYFLHFSPTFSGDPLESWDDVSRFLYARWKQENPAKTAMPEDEMGGALRSMFDYHESYYNKRASKWLDFAAGEYTPTEDYRQLCGELRYVGWYYGLREITYADDGTCTAVFDGVRFFDGEFGLPNGDVSENMRILRQRSGSWMVAQSEEFAETVYAALCDGVLTPDETLTVQFHLQYSIESPFELRACSRQ